MWVKSFNPPTGFFADFLKMVLNFNTKFYTRIQRFHLYLSAK